MRASAGGPLQSKYADGLVDTRSGLKFPKNPRWIDQKLMFLDIHDRCVKSVDLNGSVQTVATLPYVPGFLAVLADGGLVVSDARSRNIYRLEMTGPTLTADLTSVAGFYLSDGIFDARGGMYVSDVGFDFLDPFIDPAPNGVLIYTRHDGVPFVVAENIFFPNGMIITPNNKTLIVAEKMGHRLSAFDIETDGSLRNRRVWAQFRDDVSPDGICLDREGAIWVAGTRPGALRVREGGETVNEIATKRPVIATMLGGPERRHLFMCTSDSDDPIITRRVPGATIDIAEVEISGVDFIRNESTSLPNPDCSTSQGGA